MTVPVNPESTAGPADADRLLAQEVDSRVSSDSSSASPSVPADEVSTLLARAGDGGGGLAAVVLGAAVAARPVQDVVRLVRLLVPGPGDELHRALRVAALVRSVDEVAELSSALSEPAADPGGSAPADVGSGRGARPGPRATPVGRCAHRRVRSGARASGSVASEATSGARALGGARRVRGAAVLDWVGAMALLVAAAAEFAGHWRPGLGMPIPVWSVPLGAGAVLLAWLLVRRGGAVVGWILVATVCVVPVAGRGFGRLAAPQGWSGWTATGAEVAVVLLAVCALPAYTLPVRGRRERRSTDDRPTDSLTSAIE
jgi:hypothetical protein